MSVSVSEHAVCLGCGCACDDIGIAVEGGRITAAANTCPLGVAWYGDGILPARCMTKAGAVQPDAAIRRVAELLAAGPAMVYLAPELTTEAQREAIALADRTRARPARTVVAVDIGGARGPTEASARLGLAPADEAAALGIMRATLAGRDIPGLSPALKAAADLARQMSRARYVTLVHDAEPGDGPDDSQRAEGLVGLAQALNGPTRCALASLRAGGNRSGADAAMTWQTGFPFAVDFGPGFPRYRPEEPASIALGGMASVLVVGAVHRLPAAVLAALAGRRGGVIGPRASEAPFPTDVAIDTGVAGIHEAGIAYRMDEVPLPIPALLPGPPPTRTILRAVAAAVAPAPATASR